jgi:hypothetical protein
MFTMVRFFARRDLLTWIRNLSFAMPAIWSVFLLFSSGARDGPGTGNGPRWNRYAQDRILKPALVILSDPIHIANGFGWGGGHVNRRLFGRNESWFVEDVVCPNMVEFIFPASDDDGGDAVSDHVRHGARLSHEPIDAENEDHAFDGDGFHG